MKTFFSKRKKENKKNKETYLAEEVYVLKTVVTSNYYDGTGLGPRCVTMYFLASRKEETYYELFSGRKIEKESDTISDNFRFMTFNVPYIEEVKSITEYSKEKSFRKDLLFDFITEMNVLNVLGAFEEKVSE